MGPPPPGLEHVVPVGFKRQLCGSCDETGSQCSTSSGANSQGSTDHESSSQHSSEADVASIPAGEQLGCYVPGRILKGMSEAPERKAMMNLAGVVHAGTPGLPSVGSACHHLGLCKPCDFLHRSSDGCTAGAACKFCHLCGPDENKRRKALKKNAIRAVRQWQHSEAHTAATRI